MRFIKFQLFIVLILIPTLALAHYTVQDTGDLLKEDEMQFSSEVQFVTSGDEGVNLIGRFDKGFDSDSNLRFLVGAGTTDFEIGAFYKWVPFPDFESQPAIGLTLGTHVAKYAGHTELGVRAIPFVSKKFETDHGDFTPYIALPLAYANYDHDGYSPIHLTLGTRYRHPDFEQCDFTAELGFDLHEAFSYVSIGAIFPAF